MPVYYDNTRLAAWKRCPRFFYFRHVRHWTGTRTAVALTFGLAWHNAMDVVWSLVGKKSDEEVVKLAMIAFEEVWVEAGLPSINAMSQDDKKELAPRTPDTAIEMLWNYVQQRKKIIIESELVAVEVPFAVPLDPDSTEVMYIGRLDKVIKHAIENILVIEHKTTSWYKKDGGFRSEFVDSFSPNSQVDGYTHASHMLHGKDAKAVWIDAALVHRTVHDAFKFIPIERQLEQLDSWLHDTLRWISDIEFEKGRYDAVKGKDSKFLQAFPKNTDACFHFGMPCTYRDTCRFVANPEHRYPEGQAPDQMIVEKWEPFDVLGLDKIGLKKEDDK